MSEHATFPDSAGCGLALAAPACATLLADLPRARGLDAAMEIADAARRTLIGPGLLTVNLLCSPLPPAGDAGATLVLQRAWTSDPAAYPVAGRKRKALTPWTRKLLLHGEPFIGEGREVLEAVFDDHALIASLGLQAVINVPVFDGQGGCIATFNLLGTEPRWTPEAISLARLLAALCSPAIAHAVMMGPVPAAGR
ncbi:GAF domain-containing protein [Acidovorax sacchari]|uniref:GAF domain-containing protein n=1 Tax=Acidovorax sacchari TaxID=3230736 RepID=UPI0039E4D496